MADKYVKITLQKLAIIKMGIKKRHLFKISDISRTSFLSSDLKNVKSDKGKGYFSKMSL